MSTKHTIIIPFLLTISACGSQSVAQPEHTQEVAIAPAATLTETAIVPTPTPVASVTPAPEETPAPTASATPAPVVAPPPVPVVTPVAAPLPVATPAPTFTPMPGPTAQPIVVYPSAPTPAPVTAPTPIATPVAAAPVLPPYDYATTGVTWVLGNCSPLHASLMQFERGAGGVYSVVGAPNDDVLIEADAQHNYATMGEITLVLPYNDTTISITCHSDGQCDGVSTLYGTPVCNNPSIAPGG